MLDKRKIFPICAGIIAVIIIASYALLPSLLLKIRDNIVAEARPLLNAQLEVGNLTMVGINKIRLEQLTINKADKTLISLPETTLTIAFSNIFSANKLQVIEKIELTQAQINLEVNAQEEWNIQDLLKPSETSQNKLQALVIFQDSIVNIKFPEQDVQTKLNGTLDTRVAKKYNLDLKLDLQEVGQLTARGILDEQGRGKVEFNSADLAVAKLEKLIAKYTTLQNVAGSLQKINLIYQNADKGKLLSGKLEAKDLTGKKQIENMQVNFAVQGPLQLTDNVLRFASTQVKFNEAQAELNGEVFLDNGLRFRALTAQVQAVELQKFFPELPVQGQMQGSVQLDGSIDNLVATGLITADKLLAQEMMYSSLKLPFKLQQNQLFLEQGEVTAGAGKIKINAEYGLRNNKINILASAENIELGAIPQVQGLTGSVNLDFVAAGVLSAEKVELLGNISVANLKYHGLTIKEASLDFTKNNDELKLYNAHASVDETGEITLQGGIKQQQLDLDLTAQGIPAQVLASYGGVEARGKLNATAKIQGTLDKPAVWANINSGKIVLAGQNIDAVVAEGRYQGSRLEIANLEITTSKIMNLPQGKHRAQGVLDFTTTVPEVQIEVVTSGARIDELATAFLPIKLTGFFDNQIKITGKLNQPQIAGQFKLWEGSANGFLLDRVVGSYDYRAGELLLKDVEVASLQALARINGKMSGAGDLDFSVQANNIDLRHLPVNKEYTPQGYADFTGKLTGNVRQPVFKGNVQAKKIKLLNQEFTDVSGSLKSEIGLKTEFDLNFRQGTGQFDFYGGLDLLQAYLYGKLAVENADIASLLALGKSDLEATGLLTGEINLNRRGKGTGIEVLGQIQAGSVRKIPLQNIKVDILLDKRKVQINKFEALQGQQGKLVLLGNAEFAGAVNLELAGQNLDAKLLTVLSKEPVDLTGNLDLLMQVTGQTLKPDISTSVQIANGALNSVAFDNLYALLTVEQLQKLNIQQLFIEKQGYKASAYGYIPMDIFKPYAERKDKAAQMDILFKLDNADVGILTTLTKQVAYAKGAILGDLRVTGDFNAPQLYGSIKTNKAVVKLAAFKNPLLELNLDIDFLGKKVRLKELSAQMGEGNLLAVGDLNINGNGVDNYQLDINLNKLAIDSAYTAGPLTANLVVKPQPQKSRPVIQGRVLLDNLIINIPTIPEFGAGTLPAVGLDIAIDIGKNLKMYNPLLYDLDLEGNLKVLGSLRYPNIDGTIRVTRGTINYLRTPFKVKSAILGFPLQGSLIPSINLYATSRLFRTDIFLNVRGPVDEMDLKLTSNPPMSQQELFRMLTLRTQATNTTAVEGEDAKALLAAGLQMSVFGELESAVRDTLGIDEFRLYQGELLTGTTFGNNGKKFGAKKDDYESYNVLVSKYITDKVLLGYTTTLDREHYNYYMQYEVDKRINFNVGWDESRRYRYGVEYKINF